MKRPFPLVLACLFLCAAAVRAQTPPTPPQPTTVAHRCTCGCEVSGQCKCPNCSVGCGFLKPPVGNPPWTPVLAQAPAPVAAPAYLRLICPFNAVVTIDGQPTQSQGFDRLFETAPFAGKGTLVVRICTSGRNGEYPTCRKYDVTVEAGQTAMLTSFGAPAYAGQFQGCPNGQCGQQATYGSFPQMFQGFQGGCANGQCGGSARGGFFRGR